MSRNSLLFRAVPLVCAVALTGCGIGTVVTSGSSGTLALQGMVHGGQQGVAGSSIQLYTVGNTGNGAAATPMLTTAVTTDAGGNFSISGDYTCGKNSSGSTITSSNQVYLVATGGNPGQAAGTNNAALVMVSALGPCSNLASNPFTFVNEITTVAAAWALAPFATSAANISASATNSAGITNAFLDAGLLANTTTGTPTTLPANLSVETGKLNALADALASCINSDGTTACSPLFTAATAGTAAPTDTFSAALNIVKHPGQNVAGVFSSISSYVPFPTTLIQAPNDWTMSLTVTGGGLATPTALGIDSQNNIWVADENGPLSAFNPQGTPLSTTGFGLDSTRTSQINQVYGLAIDPSDNIWVTNYNAIYSNNGAVSKFLGAGSGSLGSIVLNNGYNGFTDGSIQYPFALAADTTGQIYIANTGNGSATVYSSTGGLLYPDLGASSSLPVIPQAIAIDAAHGFWLPGGSEVDHVSASSTQFPNGQVLSRTICCQLSNGVATDASGNVWVGDYIGGAPAPNNQGSFDELSSSGTIVLSNVVAGGINHPQTVVVDAAQNVWFSNLHGSSLTEIAGNGGTSTPGTALSPSTGTYAVGGFGLDASLNEPFGIAPDASGNIWVSNKSSSTVTMFFGLAAPTLTPLRPTPTAP